MIYILDVDFFNNIHRKVGFLLRVLNHKDFRMRIYKRNNVYSFAYCGLRIFFTDMKFNEDFTRIDFICGRGVTSRLYIFDFIPKDKNPKDLII